MSASSRPTAAPSAARASARFTAVVLLPTPPLPDATATMFLTLGSKATPRWAAGAPIMIAAENAGKSPQEFVAEIAAGRKPYLEGFHIAFDNWHSTDAPENHELAQQIYRDLKANGLVSSKVIEQFFDPAKNMFLPDRFIKGECPNCHAKDQYGDNCEVCSK